MLSSFTLTRPPTSFLRTMLSQFKHRSRIGIVIDIMDTVMRSHPRRRTKTQIMRGARLSYEQASRYIDLLMMCDFIRGEKTNYGDRSLVQYSLTSSGFEFWKQLRTLHMTLELFGRKSI